MLVIASDLHLTDGTSGTTISDGAFRVFRQRLRDLAYDASFRGEQGIYRPIERLDVVLLGDILDVIRSNKWLNSNQNGIRPWDDLSSTENKRNFFELTKEITTDILDNERNEKSFEVLRGLTQSEDLSQTITIPPAKGDSPDPDVGWQPDAPKRVPVEVRIHYMIGNHDWFFYMIGDEYNQLRAQIVEKLGLANNPNLPFAHDPADDPTIEEIMQEHRVFARHGDIYDPFNFQESEGRRASSLGDAIVIELLNRFPNEVQKHLGDSIPDAVHLGLRELDNVRPLPMIPVWIEGLLQRAGANKKQRKDIEDVWDDLSDKFLKLDFVREQDRFGIDIVDWLQVGLRLSKGVTIRAASKLISKLALSGGQSETYKAALSEREYQNRRARYIVYGHTHKHEVVPLDISQPPNELELRQVYVNSGTWRRVHERTIGDKKHEEFVPYNVMTYLAFFKGDERLGRPFEAWSGALGVAPGLAQR